MSGEFFPKKEEIAKRLDKRFGGVSASRASKAKEALEQAVGAKWDTEGDIRDRRKDILDILALLDSGGTESKVAYLQRAVDLQLTKAGGILMYSALVAAIVGVLFQKEMEDGFRHFMLVLSSLMLVVSAILTISTSMTHWPSEKDFASSESEAEWLIGLLVNRGCRTNVAVPLAIVATVFVPIGVFGKQALELTVNLLTRLISLIG